MAPPAAAVDDSYACATCGAPLVFDPTTSCLACDHCGATQPIELATGAVPRYDLFGKTAIASLHASQVASGGREVECKQCGARAIVTRRAERCAFCDAPMVVEIDQGSAAIPPGGVIPFAIGGKEGAQRLGKWLATRWFAPGDLVARSRRDRLDGVYLPYWAFDARSTTQYDGQRGTVHTETETYTDSNGQQQTRTVEHVDWFPVSGTVTASSKDVLVVASKTLKEDLVARLGPWNLPRLRIFDPRFLAGFTAECYQLQPSDGFTVAYPTIEAQIKAQIRRDIGGDRQKIDGMNVQWDAVSFRSLLLPLWLSSFRYREKVYHVAVNAQTGEVIGERPYSVRKIALFALAVAALIAAIVALVYWWQNRPVEPARPSIARCAQLRTDVHAAYEARAVACKSDADCMCLEYPVPDVPCDLVASGHSGENLIIAMARYDDAGCPASGTCPATSCKVACVAGSCARVP